MKSRKSLWLVGMTILAVILSSCNLGATPAPTEDPGVIQTQAFSVVLTQAALQQTQTALAIPPTALPTNTPFPTATLGEAPHIRTCRRRHEYTFCIQHTTAWLNSHWHPSFQPWVSLQHLPQRMAVTMALSWARPNLLIKTVLGCRKKI